MFLAILVLALPVCVVLAFLAMGALVMQEALADPPGTPAAVGSSAHVRREAICDPECLEESSIRLPAAVRSFRRANLSIVPGAEMIGWH